ncbi:MAG: GGDEF domain-containing protein [Spirulinaceae cyanobacterium RM2_2_10]|nr:GGDEF domain-containing protein [Spirulinaceae cyanobacterium SM2_1_0]NJO19818.1 GGDEF domain-containing protein [Spirulinaceae cyanobacterium RM2_2_10]
MSSHSHSCTVDASLQFLTTTAQRPLTKVVLIAVLTGYLIARLYILYSTQTAVISFGVVVGLQVLLLYIALAYGWRVGLTVAISIVLFHMLLLLLAQELGHYSMGDRITYNVGIIALNFAAGYISDLNRRLLATLKANHMNVQKLQQQYAKLQQLVQRDSLTQLYNRRYFYEQAEALLGVARASGRSLGIILLDLDRFKQINDTYGHVVGDRVLQAVGICLATEPGVIAARLGGEEFSIVQADAEIPCLLHRAERLRAAIAALTFEELAASLRVTASFGVTAVLTSDRSLDRAIARADAALYEAKRQGRNCIRVRQEQGVAD